MTEHLAAPQPKSANGRYSRLIDGPRIESFYSALNFKARRRRFGACVTDMTIRSYCRSINWNSIIAIGLDRGEELEAILELHPFGADGSNAELVIASRSSILDIHTLPTLLRLSSLVAAAAGVRAMVFTIEPGCTLVTLLHLIGKVTIREDQASVDLHLHSQNRR
jgi:hypothetical protein